MYYLIRDMSSNPIITAHKNRGDACRAYFDVEIQGNPVTAFHKRADANSRVLSEGDAFDLCSEPWAKDCELSRKFSDALADYYGEKSLANQLYKRHRKIERDDINGNI